MEGKEKTTQETPLELFLCDVDGTLLTGSDRIDPEDVRAIQAWKQQGGAFGLVTGRGEAFCRQLMKQTGYPADCLMSNNGATVWWEDTRLDAVLIDAGRIEEVFHALKEYLDVCVPFLTVEDGSHYFPVHELGESRFVQMKKEQAHLRYFQEQDLYEYLHQHTQGHPKLSIYTRDAENTNRLLPVFRDLFAPLEVMPTSYDYIEITQKGADKATALNTLIKTKGFQKEHIAYIGDAENDIPLFQSLTNTYVMESAVPEVKKEARTVVQSVSQAIEERMKINVQKTGS